MNKEKLDLLTKPGSPLNRALADVFGHDPNSVAVTAELVKPEGEPGDGGTPWSGNIYVYSYLHAEISASLTDQRGVLQALSVSEPKAGKSS